MIQVSYASSVQKMRISLPVLGLRGILQFWSLLVFEHRNESQINKCVRFLMC